MLVFDNYQKSTLHLSLKKNSYKTKTLIDIVGPNYINFNPKVDWLGTGIHIGTNSPDVK